MQWDIKSKTELQKAKSSAWLWTNWEKKELKTILTADQDAFQGLGFGNMGLPSVLTHSLSFWGLPERNIHRGKWLMQLMGEWRLA